MTEHRLEGLKREVAGLDAGGGECCGTGCGGNHEYEAHAMTDGGPRTLVHVGILGVWIVVAATDLAWSWSANLSLVSIALFYGVAIISLLWGFLKI